MAVDIQEYLDVIADDKEGEDVIIAIHDAALKLNTDAYKTASIQTLLSNIKTKIFGKEIRMDIHEILRRLSEDIPEGANVDVCTGAMTLVYTGGIAEFDSIDTINGAMAIEE